MADKKLSYDQIADKNLFDPLKKEIEKVNDLLKLTEDNLKNVVKTSSELAKSTPLDSYENIEKVEKSIKDTTKAVEELDVVEKERIKIQNNLDKLGDERVKQNIQLRQQLLLETKAIREQAKANVQVTNAYEKLTKQTNEAQKEFKRLAAQHGVNSKEAVEAGKRFDDLDERLREINKSAKDGRRDVGRYSDAIEESGKKGIFAGTAVDDLKGKFKALLANPIILFATALAGALALLFKAFQSSSKGAILLRKGAALLEAGFSVLTKFVNNAVEAIISFAKDPVQGIKDLGDAILRNIINRFKAIPELVGGVGKLFQQLFAGEFSKLSGTAIEIGNSFLQLGTGVEDASSKISGLLSNIDDIADAFLKLEEAQRRVRVENRNLSIQLAETQKAQELIAAQAEDDGRSLEEQRKAIRAAAIERQKQAEIELRIAKNNLDLLNREVDLRRRQGQDIKDLLDEQAQARIEFVEKQKESTLAIFENGVRERMIVLDIFDQELDDLIDFGDNFKTIREQQSADERNSFELRRKALEDANRDIEKSFKNQIKLFDETVNALKVSRGEAADFALPIDELLGIEDATELNERIKSLDLVERQRIRLLELIREIRTARNDLTTATNDLNDAEKESNKIAEDTALIGEAIMSLKENEVDVNEVLNELAEKRLQTEIDNLRVQIDSSKKLLQGKETTNAQIIALDNELNEKLLQQQQARIAKEEEQERASLEKQRQLYESIFGVISELISSRFDQRISEIDEEIAAEEKRADRLRELAEQGNEDAQNNLAVTQKRQAEAELERERQLQRQKQSEFVLSAIETYGAKVSSGEPNPLASTIADISVLRTFLGTLQSFFDGTEDTGTVSTPMDSNGGRLAVIHDNERIIPKKHNKLIGSMSNMELAMMAQNSKNTALKNSDVRSNENIVRELRDLKRITREKPVNLGYDYDAIEQSIISKVRKGGTLERRHKKTGGIWG